MTTIRITRANIENLPATVAATADLTGNRICLELSADTANHVPLELVGSGKLTDIIDQTVRRVDTTRLILRGFPLCLFWNYRGIIELTPPETLHEKRLNTPCRQCWMHPVCATAERLHHDSALVSAYRPFPDIRERFVRMLEEPVVSFPATADRLGHRLWNLAVPAEVLRPREICSSYGNAWFLETAFASSVEGRAAKRSYVALHPGTQWASLINIANMLNGMPAWHNAASCIQQIAYNGMHSWEGYAIGLSWHEQSKQNTVRVYLGHHAYRDTNVPRAIENLCRHAGCTVPEAMKAPSCDCKPFGIGFEFHPRQCVPQARVYYKAHAIPHRELIKRVLPGPCGRAVLLKALEAAFPCGHVSPGIVTGAGTSAYRIDLPGTVYHASGHAVRDWLLTVSPHVAHAVRKFNQFSCGAPVPISCGLLSLRVGHTNIANASLYARVNIDALPEVCR